MERKETWKIEREDVADVHVSHPERICAWERRSVPEEDRRMQGEGKRWKEEDDANDNRLSRRVRMNADRCCFDRRIGAAGGRVRRASL